MATRGSSSSTRQRRESVPPIDLKTLSVIFNQNLSSRSPILSLSLYQYLDKDKLTQLLRAIIKNADIEVGQIINSYYETLEESKPSLVIVGRSCKMRIVIDENAKKLVLVFEPLSASSEESTYNKVAPTTEVEE